MLKLLSSSSSCLQGRLHSLPSWPSAELGSPVLRVLGSLAGLTRPSSACRAFYSSDSGDGSDQVVEVEFMVAGTEAESSSAIVSTNPRPEDYLTVIALPLPHRPLFPGFYMPINVKDPKLLAALQESRKRQAPYAGAFLLKDKPGTDPSLVSGSETDKNIHELKGKELFNRLHEVGTLAQISSIQGDQVVLIGHRRLRITEMVDEEPLTVKVDHLKDKPYNKDNHVIDATSFELTSHFIDRVKTCSNWLDHVKTYTQILELQYLVQTNCKVKKCLKS